MTGTGFPDVSIVMRSRNDGNIIAATLDGVRRQRGVVFELVHVDNASTDDTVDIIKRYSPDPILVRIPDGDYVPGIALMEGVAAARAPIVVFLNSDAIPDNEHWLAHLIAPLENAAVGAVYGRQKPHTNARPIVVRDHAVAFPDGQSRPAGVLPNKSWSAFFSMANSATRRDVLDAWPIPTDIQFSEDIKWASMLRDAGLQVQYVPDAAVRHSHNYTFSQAWRRFRGEGEADRQIFGRRPFADSLLPAAFVPFVGAVGRDLLWMVSNRRLRLSEIGYAFKLRFAQKLGRYAGLRQRD